MKIPAGFELIGYVSVDSGTLMVVDPCYVDEGFDYDKWDPYGKGFSTLVLEPPVPFSVVISTAHGDGEYPVYGYKDRNGQVTAFLVDTDPEVPEDDYATDWDADDEWDDLEADRSFGGYGDM